MVLLDLLWERYARDVPYARVFLQLAGSLRNDHVAFRGLAGASGIALFEEIFARRGWRRAGSYDFPDAHLDAIHMTHPAGMPRIFLSELRTTELSAGAQAILAKIVPPPAPPDDVVAMADWFDGPAEPIVEDDLLALERESQYAAWVYAFGRRVNHFTPAVDDVEAWQARMIEAGVPMKRDIEGAPGSVLRQTATQAAEVTIRLAGGRERTWPYAYLEIAERQPGFDGFLGPQARQLFDMTQRGA